VYPEGAEDMIKDMIKRHEGYSSAPYKDTKEFSTIGWGHNLQANTLPRDIEIYLGTHHLITPDMAERLLEIDINLALASCKRLYPDFDNFTDARKDALLDFVYNVGEGTARQFKKARKAINAGDWETASQEMQDSAWFKQVGKRSLEVVKMIQEG
jgi:lysozyme